MKRVLHSAKVDFVRRKSNHLYLKNNKPSSKVEQKSNHQASQIQVRYSIKKTGCPEGYYRVRNV